MSETLRDHTLAWLDSIGADGLMHPRTNKLAWSIDDIKAYIVGIDPQLVPAYRHADGTYHTEKAVPIDDPCRSCDEDEDPFCGRLGGPCEAHKAWYKYWLAHKEATK